MVHPCLKFRKPFTKSYLALAFPCSGKIRLQNEPRSRISVLGKNSFTKRTSLSHFRAWEKMIYKINLALVFLGSGKIRLQNEFFLLYYPKQRFLMSSCEVTKAQIYINF